MSALERKSTGHRSWERAMSEEVMRRLSRAYSESLGDQLEEDEETPVRCMLSERSSR